MEIRFYSGLAVSGRRGGRAYGVGMVAGLGLLAVSAVMLIAGAELFTENAAAAARGLGISVFGAAFLLAGAEPEEMITAVIASGRHRPGLAAGDAIGASLTMLTLVLGLAALARPLPFGGRVRGYAIWSALAGGLAALAIAAGRIGRWEGGLLLAAYLAGVALLWWRERTPPVIGEAADAAEPDEEGTSRPAVFGLALALAGVALMAAGGWLAVGGAERVVAALRLADSAVGLTLLALATTAELFALAWAAMRRGVTEIAVAGVVGSVAYNATASLGVAALVRPLATGGILAPAIAAAGLPAALLAVALLTGTFAGLALAAVYGGVQMARKKATRNSQLPLGPFILLGVLAALVLLHARPARGARSTAPSRPVRPAQHGVLPLLRRHDVQQPGDRGSLEITAPGRPDVALLLLVQVFVVHSSEHFDGVAGNADSVGRPNFACHQPP